ncbi:uncharacterized protein LOC128549058 isoform X2 [Mercenaria mercenaria]|uniref:uncharacterized protein LOC128549058 isoform X2 n=1 Tax=Mercenaria mercenaria TaxID=6596 RepID=UPI00234E4149|nr:uncharacterized protein LOC128549058 isoform X2 [Mercenaria mercenaria]
MSDNCEERTYYHRTLCMYMDLTKETLLKLFRYLIQSEDITRFLTSVDTISKLFDLFKNGTLNKTEYNLVRSSWPDPEKFDIALLLRLIIELCRNVITEPQLGWKGKLQPKDESLGADLIRLRDVRNKLIGHRAEAKLSKAEYEKIWDKVQAVLVRVVEMVEPESKNEFVTKLDGYKQYKLDTERTKVKRYLDELSEYKQDVEKLQNKVEELSEKAKEFHVYFERTPERYVRYLKQLFDGGRLVLCGVFERELQKYGKGLNSLVSENREILQFNFDKEYQSFLFPSESNEINYTSWDVGFLASVILLVFTDINAGDIHNIEQIKHARLSYAEQAFICLDADKFLLIWTDLISSLKHLSMNIDEEKKLQVENFIDLYKKKSDGGDADEYLDQLRKCGVPVKTLKDIYRETVYQLRQMTMQLDEKGIEFKKPLVLKLKLLTTCHNEENKKHAEDFLETHLEASLHGSDQQNTFIGIETDDFVSSITTHPDVALTGIQRGCIILSFASSTPGGLLHLLDYFHSQHFNERLHNISNELYYLYEVAFLLQGYVTLESLSSAHTVVCVAGSKENKSENGLSLPLKCFSVEGLRHVLTTLKSDQTTNRLNSIADKISAELKETVTITVFPDLLSFRDVFEKTDSEATVSRGNYEDESVDRYPEQENRSTDTVKDSLEQLSVSSVSPESTFVDEDSSVLLRANLKTSHQKDKEQSMEPIPKEGERHSLYRFQAPRELETDHSGKEFEDKIELDDNGRLRRVLSLAADEDDGPDKFLFQEPSMRYRLFNSGRVQRHSEPVIGVTEERESREAMSKFAQGFFKASSSEKQFDRSLETVEKYFQEMMTNASNVTEEKLKGFKACIKYLFHLQNDETQVETESFAFLPYIYPNQQRQRIENKRSRLERLQKDFTIFKRGLMMKVVSEDELYIANRQAYLKTSLQKDKEQSVEPAPQDFERHRHYRFQALGELGTDQSEDDFQNEIEPDEYDRPRSVLSPTNDEVGDYDKFLFQRLSSGYRQSESVIEMTEDRESHETMSKFALGLLKTSLSVKDFDKSLEIAEKYFQETVKYASNITEEELKAFNGQIEDLFHLHNDETHVETEISGVFSCFYPNQQRQRIENKRSRLERLRKDFTTFKQKLMMKVVSEDELYIQEKQELRDYLIKTYKNKFAEGVYRRQAVVRRFPQLHTQTPGCLQTRGCNLTCSDVSFKTCRKCKNICVIGEERLATSFCLNLVTDWCDEKSSGEGLQGYMCHECECKLSVKEFEFVLMISLCDVGKEVFIPNMVKKYLLKSEYKDIFEKVIERESEKCLILLDGLSQWGAKSWSHLNMLERNLMDDYVVLTTASRWERTEYTGQVFYLI